MQKVEERSRIAELAFVFLAGNCCFPWLLSWAIADFWHPMTLTWFGAMVFFLVIPALILWLTE